MNCDELNFREEALIEILRSFNFLSKEGYEAKEFSLEGRGLPSVVYYNYLTGRKIHVIGDENPWSIVIERKKLFAFRKDSSAFEISDYFKYFNCSLMKGRNYSLKSLADFMKQHLMPVIRGEVWIDELIKLKK